MVDLQPSPARPRPILDAVQSSLWIRLAGALVTAAIAFGIMTAEQGTTVEALFAALVGVLTAGTASVSAFRVLHKAEPDVTPVADPQDNQGRRLVPERRPLL